MTPKNSNDFLGGLFSTEPGQPRQVQPGQPVQVTVQPQPAQKTTAKVSAPEKPPLTVTQKGDKLTLVVHGDSVTIPAEAENDSDIGALKYTFCDENGNPTSYGHETRVELTREFAAGYLVLPKLPKERRMRTPVVAHYRKEMIWGRFIGHEARITIGYFSGVWWKLNGQHTCSARMLIQSDTLPYPVIVPMIRLRFDSMEDMKAYYASLDRGLVRSRSHLAQVLLQDIPEFADFPMAMAGALERGLTMWKFGTKQVDVVVTTSLLETEYLELAAKVGRWLARHSGSNAKVNREAIVAAAFATFNVVEEAVALEFWDAAATKLGVMDSRDPRGVLYDWLSKAVVNMQRQKGRKFSSNKEIFNMCITAWEKWRKGILIEKFAGPRDKTRIKQPR